MAQETAFYVLSIVVSTKMQAKVGPVFSHNNKVNTRAARMLSILVD